MPDTKIRTAWLPQSIPGDYASQLDLDFSTTNAYLVEITKNYNGDVISPKFVTVENFSASASLTVNLNGLDFTIPASNRIKININAALNSFRISSSGVTGTARLQITEVDYVTDSNSATSSSGAATTLETGMISAYAGNAAPTGYLLCDGSAIARTTYLALFTVLGIAFGAGDGVNTFNVPNLKGRIVMGAGIGTITETLAAANFNVSDVITVANNTITGKPKWSTGQVVQVTTDGVLPTGILAATNYFVGRLSATTISLYTTLAGAILAGTTARVDITATGSGNHTLTDTLTNRVMADVFGVEIDASVISHTHTAALSNVAGLNAGAAGSSSNPPTTTALTTSVTVNAAGSNIEGSPTIPPVIVLNYIIKT